MPFQIVESLARSAPVAEPLELLYQALHSPLGIEIRSDDVPNALFRLYAARRNSGDPDLDRLQMRRQPDPSLIWIVRGKAPPPADPGPGVPNVG